MKNIEVYIQSEKVGLPIYISTMRGCSQLSSRLGSARVIGYSIIKNTPEKDRNAMEMAKMLARAANAKVDCYDVGDLGLFRRFLFRLSNRFESTPIVLIDGKKVRDLKKELDFYGVYLEDSH